MPIGSINKESTPKRENYRPPWVKDSKDADAAPSWTQRRLRPVESTTKTMTVGEGDEAAAAAIRKPTLKPVLKKQSTIKEKSENGITEPAEDNLIKPSQAKLADRSSKLIETKVIKPALKTKTEDKQANNDKTPEKSTLKSVKTNNEKPKEKTVTIIDRNKPTDKVTRTNTVTTNDRNLADNKVTDKSEKNSVESVEPVKTAKPIEKVLINKTPFDKTAKTTEKSIDKNLKTLNGTDTEKLPSKLLENLKKKETKQDSKPESKPELKPVSKTELKSESKSTSKPESKSELKTASKPEPKTASKSESKTESKTNLKTESKPDSKTTSKLDSKSTSKPEEKADDNSKMATKPPSSKLPPRKPSLQKQLSKEDGPVKKWRDPLHERVKENIDKTLANEIPKGHTLTKNESLRSLLKPTPPPMPPPLPPKLPPPPEFKKAPIDPDKLKKIEQLKSRPRRRPDWTDMMKEVEQGKKLKHVVCNDRSSPVITRSSVVKNKDQFIFESEKQNAHNDLLKQINKGIRLKKTKTNDRSKPNLEGLRKFRRQMTIEEQVQKSMSQANLAASPSGTSVAEVPGAEEEDIDEMDDIDKVRDDLQSTKQLLAIELRNKEAQERENKRLLTRIQNLEAELARERAIIKQEQHKTVISVTDAYDERLVNSLKMEVDRAKETADNLEKQYLEAAEERDTALTELEEVKRKNAEMEKKLEQALSNKIEQQYISEEPMSFYMKRQLDFEKECKLLNIDINSSEAQALRKCNNDLNNNVTNAIATNGNEWDEGILPSTIGSRRSSHAIKQLSVQKDSSFEEEEESEEEEEESEEKKQKRLEKEVRNMKSKIRHLKEKQDNMKKERAAYKVALKNQQAALKHEKTKYKELKREVDKMAAMMKECGSDEEDEEEESEESSEEKKSETEEEESETETEQDTESETESESEPEEAPLPNKKENLTTRMKRHETRVNALKKGNALLMANVDRLKDDVNKQREESVTLQKELDSLIEDFE